MKIVFLSARFPPDFIGGGELSTATIAEGLAARGHDVTVLTGALEDRKEEKNGVRVIRSAGLHRLWAKPLFERQTSLRMVGELTRHITPDVDVLHAHDFRSALLLSLIDHPYRVVTVRDFAPICGTTNNMWFDGQSCDGCFWTNVLFRCHRVVEASPARKPFRVWQYKYNLGFRGEAFRAIPHHVYTSGSLRSRVASRLELPPSNVVIPNPVGSAWLSSPTDVRTTDQRIVYAGRLETTKGIDVLLEAVTRLRNTLPTVKLDLLGDGDIEGTQKKINDMNLQDVVTLQGKVSPEDVRAAFDTARVVVQPSLWEEPFGRTVIEAFARARPVVVSDTGGLSELVTSDTGVKVPPKNPNALADGLARYLNGPEQAAAHGAAGRRMVEQKYTANAIASVYESFYARVQGRV